MEYKICAKKSDLKPEEFIEISKSVGWGKDKQYDMARVKKALKNTSFIITIRNVDGRLIGCARALSDNLLFTTIPDIFVRPEHQRKGLGTLMMKKIIERYTHTKIFFGAQPGLEKFYEKLGFEKGLQPYQRKPEV